MRREVTPRDFAILGAFAFLLAVGSYAYIRYATAPPSPQGQKPSAIARPLERRDETVPAQTPSRDVATAPIKQEASSPATLPERDYRFIAERNIFQPASEKPETPSAQPSPAPSSGRSRSTSPPPSPRGLSAPPPLPPAPPPLPATNPAPTTLASRPANLTATSIARLGGDTYVLLENPQTRDTAWVRVGESAFGYQVANAGDNYVEVRQGDVAYRITLGEGKQERKILAMGTSSGAPAPRSGTPTPPSGPPSATPTIEFRGRGGGEGESRRSSTEWMTRVMERWNQLPDFVRNRILERIRENWNQLTPEQQQQIRQAAQNFGITLP
ncbi:MAG: hypothetical protein KEFWMYNX_001479 [Candidatus Fervidibacter sp.]|jgi:Protein of unknown function (DUF3106).